MLKTGRQAQSLQEGNQANQQTVLTQAQLHSNVASDDHPHADGFAVACQGGTFSAIYASLHPDKIRNLITMVAPIDFDTDDGLLNIWARHLDADKMVDTIAKRAKTGKMGDGKIFVMPVESATRVRTGETEEDTL